MFTKDVSFTFPTSVFNFTMNTICCSTTFGTISNLCVVNALTVGTFNTGTFLFPMLADSSTLTLYTIKSFFIMLTYCTPTAFKASGFVDVVFTIGTTIAFLTIFFQHFVNTSSTPFANYTVVSNFVMLANSLTITLSTDTFPFSVLAEAITAAFSTNSLLNSTFTKQAYPHGLQ